MSALACAATLRPAERAGAPSSRCPTVEDALALGLTRAEYELVCEKQGRAPNRVELAMYSLLWSEHCAYKHSQQAAAHAADRGPRTWCMGPGENAGAVDVGGGLVCAFKVESHNHPSAVEPFQGAATGVGGHPARHLRGRRAADRGARLAALRRAVERALALPARRRRRRDRPLRQLDRRADGRRRGLLRGALRAELPGQRDGARARAARAARAQRRRRAGQPARAVRRRDRARRHRRRLGARLRGARRGRRGAGQAPERPGRRPVRGEEAAGVLARAARARPARLAAGPRRRRPDLLGRRDGLQGRRRGRHRRRPRAAARARHGAVRDHGLASPRSGCCAWSSPANVDAVLALCAQWEISGATIGAVTDERASARAARRRAASGEMPVAALVDECPLYDLDPRARRAALPAAARPCSPRDATPRARRCSRCSRSPNIASRRPLFEQYDSIVQSRTVRRPEQADAAVLALAGRRARSR